MMTILVALRSCLCILCAFVVFHIRCRSTGSTPASCFVSLFIVFSALRAFGAEPTVTRLTNDGHLKQRPAWSPDGAWLAFTRHQGATIFLFLRSADGKEEKRLTSRDAPEFDAVWSP